jgi:hypothetical protein
MICLLGHIEELDPICTTAYGRRVIAPAQYGPIEITHSKFRSTHCYVLRSDNFERMSVFKALKKEGAWYRPSKNDLIIPWSDIVRANTMISESMMEIFERHIHINSDSSKSLGDFILK